MISTKDNNNEWGSFVRKNLHGFLKLAIQCFLCEILHTILLHSEVNVLCLIPSIHTSTTFMFLGKEIIVFSLPLLQAMQVLNTATVHHWHLLLQTDEDIAIRTFSKFLRTIILKDSASILWKGNNYRKPGVVSLSNKGSSLKGKNLLHPWANFSF